METSVEGFPEKQEELSLEDDLLEASWSRYHAEIAAVQRDIHHLRSAAARRLARLGVVALKRDPASHGAVLGWLRQKTRALEVRLQEVFLCAMRECAMERAARAQAIRKFCDGKECAFPPPRGEGQGEGADKISLS